MDEFKHPKCADTEAEMRAAINELASYNKLVHRCMRAADISGLSGEDRYTLLAYHAITELVEISKAHYELLSKISSEQS